MIYKEKILVLHRNSVLQERIADYLRGNGFAVIVASNVDNSLNLAKSMKPDLILWGESLTAHSKSILRKIKESRFGQNTPVIALLPDLELFDRIEIDKLGINDVMDLSPNLSDLKIKVRFHLSNRKRIQALLNEISRLKDLGELQYNLIRVNDVSRLCELVNDHISSEVRPDTLINLIFNSNKTDFDYQGVVTADRYEEESRESFFRTPLWKKIFMKNPGLETGRIVDSYILDFFQTLGLESDIYYQFPVRSANQLIGVMITGVRGERELPKEIIQHLDMLANSLGQRISHIRQVFNRSRVVKEETSEIQYLFQHLNEDEISHYLSQQLMQQLKADVILYFNYNEGFRFLYPQYCYKSGQDKNLFEDEKPPVLMLKDYPSFEEFIETRRPSIHFNLDEEPRDDILHLTELAGDVYKSLVLFNVSVGEDIKGFFLVGNKESIKRFTSAEIHEAEKLIHRATNILVESRIVRQAQKTLKQLDRIFELGKNLTLDIDINELLKKIAGSIRRTLGWNVVILNKKNQFTESYENVAVMGIKKEEYEKARKNFFNSRFDSLRTHCFKISNSYFCDHEMLDDIPDEQDQKRFLKSIGKEWNDQDWLLVPILSRGRELGYLAVNDPVERVRPSEEKVRSLEYFANQAAVALENAALYENLKASEEKYRLLAETMVMGLVTCDYDGRILYANRSLAQILNYSQPSSLISQNLYDLCSSKSKTQLEEHILQIMKQNGISEENNGVEIELLSNDNHYIPFNIYITPVKEKGAQTGFIAVLSDLRSQRRLEQLKTEFNSMIVHDLRSPLNIIQGYIDIVRNQVVGQISEEQEELLGIAKENVDKVLKLIDNFMIASKIEAGKFELNIEIHSINALIESVYEHHLILAKKKNIELVLDLDPEISLLQFDKLRIEQVLNNYLSNALKFTDEGGKITIRSKLKKEKNELTGEEILYVHVSVQDTGVGIPYEEQEKVFSKYEQTEAGKDASLKGTGLGLAICKEIISLHEGRVWLESEPGKGSTFYFSLPIIPIKV
ncbi:MAG TPA: PAS domain-containing protein [Caldithrix abyssi]|uniref:histidine kinase n=1 Tax=Caldithrix abyssi TaxID=187145 RepID=A0A7V5UFG8_CALAY|nr:PAS domain-containing protein [Caldithrix abyssi]